MTNKTKRKSNSSVGTWHKLAPKSSRRPASMPALKKRLIGISKFFALVIILGVVGLGVWFFPTNQNNYSGPIDLTGPAVPVSKLVFVSDGVLHRNWFQNWFGPTMLGLLATLLMATIIEVCSEGSTPIAADLLTRAGAPGNSFAFMMTGVSTDYTEVMVLKDTTKSWKIALFLPLVTVPQVVVIAIVLNGMV